MARHIQTIGSGKTIWVPVDDDGENGNFEDLRFPASGINPPGAISDPDVDLTDGCLIFDKASTEVITGQAQMPHSWQAGSEIYPHIHWGPTDGTTGDVVWRFYYDIAGIGGVFSGTFTTEDITVAVAGVDNTHQLSDFSPVLMSGLNVSCMIKWGVARIGGDAADDYDNDAKLYELDFHYKINSIGSGLEYPKY